MTERRTAAPRLLKSALATTTLPLVVFGSGALAAPAMADAPRQALMPRAASPINIETAQVRIASAQLASAVPASFTGAGVRTASPAKTYTVRAGDTLSHIAVRHDLSLSALLKANGLSMNSVIHPGQKLRLSGSAASPAAGTASGSGSSASATKTYTVRSGDTLSAIAARHGVGLSTLLKANGLSTSSTIYPGQKIRLSGSAASPAASTASGTGSSASATKTYTVRSGDTLSGIAARNGLSLSALLRANGLSATAIIHPGQRLKLSGSSIATAGTQDDLVPNTFLHYTYPDHIVRDANANKRALLAAGVPSRSQMQAIVADTARRMGVDPALALAHAFTESSFNHASVSPANAIGTMQVIPSSGEWASDLVGRRLNLLDPHDNVVAGVAIIRQLQRTAGSLDVGIAAYYQGLGGVKRNGMKPDTRDYVAKVKTYMKRF